MSYTIKNPVIPGLAPDPSILRVGEDYYIANSTFHWNPGIQLFHSRDLANWELIGQALKDDSTIDLRGTSTPAGIWAPHLSYDPQSGLFWIIFSQMINMDGRMFDTNNYVMHAPSMNGPWSTPVYIGSIGFDPSLFHDDDGRHWVVTLEWETRFGYEQPGTIVLEEFDAENEKLFGPSYRLSKGGTDRGCVEAPHLYKHDGRYYLMTAEGGTGFGHGVVLQRADQITGPYESDPNNPFITSTPYYFFRKNDPDSNRFDLYNPDAPIQKAGHGSLTDTPNGEWYVAHLMSRPMPGLKSTLGRETGLQKVEWTKDGWLKMADGSTLAKDTTPGISNVTPDPTMNDLGMEDQFDGAELDVHLLSPYRHATEDRASLKENPGKLRLHGGQSFFSRFDVSILAARVDSFVFDAETKLDFKPIHFSQSAGLMLYYDNNNWLFLRKSINDETGQNFIDILQAKQGKRTDLQRVKLTLPVDQTAVAFKCHVDHQTAQFSYRLSDDQSWQNLGPALDITFMSDEAIDGFTAMMVGIGAWDAFRHESYADFDYFKVVSQDSRGEHFDGLQ